MAVSVLPIGQVLDHFNFSSAFTSCSSLTTIISRNQIDTDNYWNYGKRGFLPRDQAFPLLLTSFFLQKHSFDSFTLILSRRIFSDCFYQLICYFENSQFAPDDCRKRDSKSLYKAFN